MRQRSASSAPCRRAPSARDRVLNIVATIVEVAIVILAVVYIASGSLISLVVWGATVAVYLGVGFAIANPTSLGVDRQDRVGALGALSWVLPLVASACGVYAATTVLSAQAAPEGTSELALYGLAAAAMILSWLLLHTGFAHIYQSYFETSPTPTLRFPGTDDPALIDFLYFSFAIGTAFATSDTQVLSRRVRRTVIVHSVVGFFFNAYVIAVAFQILQGVSH